MGERHCNNKKMFERVFLTLSGSEEQRENLQRPCLQGAGRIRWVLIFRGDFFEHSQIQSLYVGALRSRKCPKVGEPAALWAQVRITWPA